MKALDVTIVAMVSIFTVSVIWVATRSPFNTVITSLNSTLNTGLSAPATDAINGIMSMYTTGSTIFIIIAIGCLIFWWWAKMQEREVVTEGYAY